MPWRTGGHRRGGGGAAERSRETNQEGVTVHSGASGGDEQMLAALSSCVDVRHGAVAGGCDVGGSSACTRDEAPRARARRIRPRSS